MFNHDAYQHVLSTIQTLHPPQPVTLIAVTKYAEMDEIQAAYDAGLRHFGENRLQVALKKIEHFKAQGIKDIHWHFIGPLQRKKVPKLSTHFSCIHSVDTLALAEKINECAKAIGQTQPIFLQVNIAREPQKHGFSPEEIGENYTTIQHTLTHLRVKGLMTMLPFECSESEQHRLFQSLETLNRSFGLAHLSMGMSQDYESAISNGSTHIRLGRTLFNSAL